MNFALLGLVLGILQGLFEWLPVSSEGQLVIFFVNFFGSNVDVATSLALFAHIGTALVVIVYYREEFTNMIKTSLSYIGLTPNEQDVKEYNKNLLLTRNLILVTIFTVPTALPSLIIFEDVVKNLGDKLNISIPNLITLFVGLLLLITGVILYYRQKNTSEEYATSRTFEELTIIEAIILGLLQGLAALPGISRSAITITYLLLGTKLNQDESLRGSFIVAVPVSLGAGFLDVVRGKILFQSNGLYAPAINAIAIDYFGMLILIATAFIVGFLTLRTFLDIAKKVNFDKFVIAFGLIAIIAVSLGISIAIIL